MLWMNTASNAYGDITLTSRQIKRLLRRRWAKMQKVAKEVPNENFNDGHSLHNWTQCPMFPAKTVFGCVTEAYIGSKQTEIKKKGNRSRWREQSTTITLGSNGISYNFVHYNAVFWASTTIRPLRRWRWALFKSSAYHKSTFILPFLLSKKKELM